jgi:HSP20 family protein
MSLMKRMAELTKPGRSEWWPTFDLPDDWKAWMHTDFPAVEQFEDDGTVVVRAELPGVDPDKDVEITITDHALRLRAERHERTRSDTATGFRSEFHYGSYLRTVPLPAGATTDDVKASYADGILEVRVPVSAALAEARKIPVTKQ